MWEAIVGQQRVKRILRSSIERDRVAHAYLFSGADGLGKSGIAIELAKSLNCERGPIDACGKCASCAKFSSLQHPNLHLVFPLPVGKGEKTGDDPLSKLPEDDITFIQEELKRKSLDAYHHIVLPKASTIKINSVREIRKESAMTMFEEGKRVFVIMDADQLGDEAANALLKTLEEPHGNTLLLLTTSQPERLLPTIVSRCQHIRFDPVTEEEIRLALVERKGLESTEAGLVASLSNGSYGRALELAGEEFQKRRDEAVSFLRSVLYKSRGELMNEISRIASEYEKYQVEELLLLQQSWLHDAMRLHEGTLRGDKVFDGGTLEKFSAHHSTADYPLIFSSIDRAISLLRKNVYIPLILINLALELRSHIISPMKGHASPTDVGTEG